MRILLTLLAVSGITLAAAPLPVSKDYWRSDAFRKSFNGSYRINARVEPFVETKERGLLVEVQELMGKGQRTAALKKLTGSALIKTSAAIMFNAGNIAYESGDMKQAQKQFVAAIKKFPTFLRAHQNLAVVYTQQDLYESAYPHLLESVKLGSQNGMVMGLLGYCYQQKGNFTSALQAFRSAQLTESQNLEWKRGEAYCHDRLGDYAKALNLYEEVVNAKPNEASYALLLANLYQRLGKGEDAIVQLELLRRKALLEDVDKILLGELHLRYGSRRLGAEVIREALKSDQLKESDAALDVVRYSIDREDHQLAQEFHGLIKSNILVTEENKNQHLRLSAWISLNDETVEDKQAALSSLESLVKKNPLDADSLYLLAGHEAKRGDKEKALLLYQQSHHGEGSLKSRSLLESGKLLVDLKRYTDALKPLQEYVKSDDSESVKTYIKAVKNLANANL